MLPHEGPPPAGTLCSASGRQKQNTDPPKQETPVSSRYGTPCRSVA